VICWIRIGDTDVPCGHDFAAPECGIRDIQIPCRSIDGHLIYREKIIKCVWRGEWLFIHYLFVHYYQPCDLISSYSQSCPM